MALWQSLGLSWDQFVELILVVVSSLNAASLAIGIPWVLMSKTNSTSATAWCLLIIFLPIAGFVLFVIFGWQHVSRPMRKKRRHKENYRKSEVAIRGMDTIDGKDQVAAAHESIKRHNFPENLANLALKFDAFAPASRNLVTLYHEGQSAYDAMLQAIKSAQHHVHMQTFIFQPDEVGDQFLQALTDKCKEGVQVRLLYDAVGSFTLPRRKLYALHRAGGKSRAFMPANPLRKRIQLNLRNHRRVLVTDGRVCFTGGLNIGKEYIGEDPGFGFWRDTHFRIEGPAAADLGHVFAEDWDFSYGERLKDPDNAEPEKSYFKPVYVDGQHKVQIIESGPDSDLKSIREVYFAAILAAKERLWIASPYFVPDDGLLDALRLAGYRGVDVRLLCLFQPDKWIPLYAARYYWPMIMKAGVRVYQYTKGMMHAKIMLVDGKWASVGSANFDNRSMYLNFETNCLFYSPEAVAELEEQFERDMADSIRLDREVYSQRPFSARLAENACRLMSPIL